MPAPHALYSKMLAERTASRNVLVWFILFIHHLTWARFFTSTLHDRRKRQIDSMLTQYTNEHEIRRYEKWRFPMKQVSWEASFPWMRRGRSTIQSRLTALVQCIPGGCKSRALQWRDVTVVEHSFRSHRPSYNFNHVLVYMGRADCSQCQSGKVRLFARGWSFESGSYHTAVFYSLFTCFLLLLLSLHPVLYILMQIWKNTYHYRCFTLFLSINSSISMDIW